MFGSINTDPAYTFTQSEDRQVKIQRSQLISKYFGNSGVQEKVQTSPYPKKSPQFEENEVTVESLRRNKTADELEESKKGVVELFDDEDEDDSGLSYDGETSSIMTSFDSLAAATGSSNDKVTKTQLIALLQNLSSDAAENPDVAKQVSFIKNLIAKFDVISDGGAYITSFNGVNEPQDYTTVTQEQVTHPIDIRV